MIAYLIGRGALETFPIYISEFQALILHEAIDREWKLLDIVTAQEREASNRDGWALARIKVRELRGVLSQVVGGLPWEAGRGYCVRPEDEADLAAHVAAVGQKMRPPRAELEKLMALKTRRRAAIRRVNPPKPADRDVGGPTGVVVSTIEEPQPERAKWSRPAAVETGRHKSR